MRLLPKKENNSKPQDQSEVVIIPKESIFTFFHCWSEMIRFSVIKKLKSDDIHFRLYSPRQQSISLSLEGFFSQTYWRVIPADPRSKSVPFVGGRILELVTDPRLYVTAPLPENQTGKLLITHLYGGNIGNFLPFEGKKEFAYVRLKPHTASTGLFQFDQLTNESNDKLLQLNISAVFANHFEVAVAPPEPQLFGVSHILRPIPGTSIVFSQSYWPNGDGPYDPFNPPKGIKSYIPPPSPPAEQIQ